MRMLAALDLILLGQRGHLFPWTPVAFACGIAAYFALRFEPGAALYGAVAALALAGLAVAWRAPAGLAVLGWAICVGPWGFQRLVGGPIRLQRPCWNGATMVRSRGG